MKTSKIQRKTFIKWSVTILALATFTILTFRLITGGPIITDIILLRFVRQFSSEILDKINIFITSFGDVWFIMLATLASCGAFYYKKNFLAIWSLIISVLGAGFLSFSLKLLFQRNRPDLWETLVLEDTFAFPSGHAMLSSVLAFSFIFIFWHTKYRKIVVPIALIYTITVGLSRIYLGVHYPSDVIAGWALGFIVAVIAREVVKKGLTHKTI